MAKLALEGLDDEGALRFGALLFLVDEREGARFWWGFAAGAENTAAAHCLHLYHRARGELRDAEHWALQAGAGQRPVVPQPPGRREPVQRDALRAAVGRLTVDGAEESGHSRVPQPAQDLADRIEELADAL
ncbi:hypothetical protein [Streptomyces sp. NPDC001770]